MKILTQSTETMELTDSVDTVDSVELTEVTDPLELTSEENFRINIKEIEEYKLKSENIKRNGELENFKPNQNQSLHNQNINKTNSNNIINTNNTIDTIYKDNISNTIDTINTSNTNNNNINSNKIGINNRIKGLKDKFVVGNDFTRTAGLSSDRCVRDFASAKNRKFYSKMNYPNDNTINNSINNSVSRSVSSLLSNDSVNRSVSRSVSGDSVYTNRSVNSNSDNSVNTVEYSNPVNDVDRMGTVGIGVNVEKIFRSNSILRNENRMKNTSHCDIFGAKECNKRTFPTQANNYWELSSNNSSIDSTERIIKRKSIERNNSFNNSNTNHIVDTFNSTKSAPKFSVVREGAAAPREKIIEENNSPNSAAVDASPKGATNPTINTVNTTNTINNVNTINSVNKVNSVKVLDNVLVRLFGLRSGTSEKELEDLCRCCKLQIVSITLDRNIINHYCTGTGKINLKSPKLDSLTNFKNLLKLNGYNFKT